ncbi:MULTISPECIES: cytochrome b [Halorhodospira]|uniref:cytochrome b n=1 Tax=Halorhodospira TaxID=85108 RepID=UPI0019115917|nr:MULTISPECIES: cytochrome bc complex cytochrome b subunit [Halorhodospira]MBK5936723.1 cytochrome b [Halorhodospira halophila]MCG5538537.1 cytochrome bc complex cytochrome b subunit [Halorhodospira sp. 9622]MCG5541102.1 cytochrome bc complex cytochrome b subunit [Halorhodospira sp. M39old]MCG5546181.1 cytochrome bc complex cytochrome b subunit [Halorhodospira sp. M38]
MNRLNLSGLQQWMDDRYPMTSTWRYHMTEYYVPKNVNWWYLFGSLSILVLVIQIVSGIWLMFYYQPSVERAFSSVEFIMRDVDWGWLMRYMHTTGASAFFLVVYLHMFRGLLYGSYKKPRELLWITGVLIYLVLMTEAFMGYVLPWGQMSYWAAQVIIALAGVIPVVGDELVIWLQGGFVVNEATLGRLFALHVVALPLVLIALVFVHIVALHHVGSSSPDGVEIKQNKDENGKPIDGVGFHPYVTVKDMFGWGIFLILFCAVMFFAPTFGGYFIEAPNFQEANPLQTPEVIHPIWYFTAWYAMLQSIPSEALGVIVMLAAPGILLFLPWIDRSPVKSIRYRGLGFKIALTAFTVSFLVLTWAGMEEPTGLPILLSQISTVIYFGFFVFLWVYTYYGFEKTKPVPERVTV